MGSERLAGEGRWCRPERGAISRVWGLPRDSGVSQREVAGHAGQRAGAFFIHLSFACRSSGSQSLLGPFSLPFTRLLSAVGAASPDVWTGSPGGPESPSSLVPGWTLCSQVFLWLPTAAAQSGRLARWRGKKLFLPRPRCPAPTEMSLLQCLLRHLWEWPFPIALPTFMDGAAGQEWERRAAAVRTRPSGPWAQGSRSGKPGPPRRRMDVSERNR